MARGCSSASPTAPAIRRGLTVLSRGGEARRQAGSQGTTRTPEQGRRRRRSLRRAYSGAGGQRVVAAHRAYRGTDDAWSCSDPRARVHRRHSLVGLDPESAPAHAGRDRSQPTPQSDTEAARPLLSRPAVAAPLAVDARTLLAVSLAETLARGRLWWWVDLLPRSRRRWG